MSLTTHSQLTRHLLAYFRRKEGAESTFAHHGGHSSEKVPYITTQPKDNQFNSIGHK